LHLVRVVDHQPGYLPPLDEVRAAVERDWLQAKSEQAKQAFYQVLRDRYDVRIDPELQVVSSTARD
jgi:parvulin-like peptidyl-prolyl isomerase